MKDHEIIALFFERSERAITELINKYGATIKNVASNILKDAQDAEEAANDTYLSVWNRIPPTRPKYLGAYSCRIARNLSLKRFYANTAEKRNSYYDVALDELEETIPALSTVESTYDAKELTGYLNRFLKNLSKEDRYLFMRRYWYGDKISDIDESFIAESMSPPVAKADHAPERTSNMGKYENKRNGVNSRKLISLILAACLIFTLAITAYALNLFGIREMFRSKNQDLPVEIDPYIQHHTETVAARDWGAQVTETFCDPTRVMVTVSVTGGDKYIVVPTDATPEHSVSVIGIDGDETLGEYAAAQGKELLCVSASLRQNEELGIFTEAMTFVNSSDSEMHILVDATRSNGNMTSNAACWVYAVNAAGERVDTLQIPVELAEAPATEAGNFVPDNPNAIPGLTVHSVTVEETPLGWTVRFISEITDDVAFENFKRMDCDELTDFDGGGFVLEDDGTWSTTWTMGKGSITDTLTVHFYDWDDQLIGDIIFKKK